MKRVLYLHGFASSPHGAKASALTRELEHDAELTKLDLNVPSFERLDYAAMVSYAEDAVGRVEPDLVIGSSLGSIVALEVAARGKRAPLLLVAPAFGVAGRWRDNIPDAESKMVYHYGYDRELPLHRTFFEQMSRITIEQAPPPARVVAIMGDNDETVPYASVRRIWHQWEHSGRLVSGSQLITVPGGDHSLMNWIDLIAATARDLLRD